MAFSRRRDAAGWGRPGDEPASLGMRVVAEKVTGADLSSPGHLLILGLSYARGVAEASAYRQTACGGCHQNTASTTFFEQICDGCYVHRTM
jgi:hypothetical protein